MAARRTAVVLIALSAFAAIAIGIDQVLTSQAIAQEVHADHAHADGPTALVDGSERPELVPDSLAIRLLMQTLRISSNPDELALKQLRTRIRRAGLDEADFQVLASELGRFDTEARLQEATVESLRPSSGADNIAVARYTEAGTLLGLLFERHYHQLVASLSLEGAVKLQNHLLHVKSRIKIYPTPDMAPRVN